MSQRILNLIVAVDLVQCIGKSGPHPIVWKQKEDMRRFRERTTGNVVIMGYNTFQSMGRPLPKRENIVVSRAHKEELLKRGDVIVVESLEEAIGLGATVFPQKELFLIGGGMLYNDAIKKDLVKCYCLTIFETCLPEHSDNSFVELPKFDSSWEKQMMGGADADEANEFYSVFVDIRSK